MSGVPERVVVRAPNWVGDVVLSLPALRDLRRSFPSSRLEVLARGWVGGLYRALPEVDGLLESRGLRADAATWRARADLAVLLPNSFGSALAPFAGRVPERWGYATDGRGPLLTRRCRVPDGVRGQSQVFYYRAMLAGVGLRVSAAPDAHLDCPDDWRARAAGLLGPSEAGFVGLNPGAFYGGAKRWLPERFAEAGQELQRATGATLVLVGSAQERGLAEAVAARVAGPVRVLTGQTSLEELAGVLAQLRLLLTNDSGPMHLAAALGTPLVAVFGPTDWRETAPWGGRSALVREPVECAPCGLRECPIDHRCMTRVSAARVAAEGLELMRRCA